MCPENLHLEARPRAVRLVESEGSDSLEAYIRKLRTEAFDEGVSQALSQAGKPLAAAVAQLELDGQRAIESASKTAVELATLITQELLRREIDLEHYELERIVRETLRESGAGRGPCQVHLNPRDAKLLEGIEFRAGTEILADEGVARGDVHVETPIGCLVREPFALLETIARRLRDEVA